MKMRTYSFAEFTFDVTSGDLARNGAVLRIPQQTSRLLAILLERAGTVVTREDLQSSLWPNGEFLDYERAINRAINYLRMVLRDNPKSPRFVETVHKRGYRFLVPVTVVAEFPSREDTVSAEKELASGELNRPLEDLASEPEATEELAAWERSAVPLPGQSQSSAPFGLSRFRNQFAAFSLALLLVAASAWGYLHFRHRSQQPTILYLGIVPLDTAGDGAQSLAESFRLDLADTLSQLPNVQLRATNSLSKTRREGANIPQLAQTLNLDVLLMGKLTVAGNRCRLELELVRGRDAVHLGSFQYGGSCDELPAIRDKVQRDIFLVLHGSGKSIQALRGSTENPEAYRAYLEARELARQRTPASLDASLLKFQLAIDRDPNFAQAYAGMATAHLAEGYFANPGENLQKARLLAEQALRLDTVLAEAHGVLGDIAFRKDWDAAVGEGELRKAVELDPRKSIYHAWLAGLLADVGRFDEAKREIDEAELDDPLWPPVYSMAAFVASAARDNNRMIAASEKFRQLVPASPYCHDQLAWSYFAAKRYEDAIAEWRSMAVIENDKPRIELEDRGLAAYRQSGIAAYAQLRLEAIERHSVDLDTHANDFDPAEWYAFTGNKDKAINALDKTVALHNSLAIQIAIDPMFDNLHRDPRFLALLSKIGLPLPASYPNSALHTNSAS